MNGNVNGPIPKANSKLLLPCFCESVYTAEMECANCRNMREFNDLEQLEDCGHIFCQECLRGQTNCLEKYCNLRLLPKSNLDNLLPTSTTGNLLTETEPLVTKVLRQKKKSRKRRQIEDEAIMDQQELLTFFNTCTSGIWKDHLMNTENNPGTALSCCGRIICRRHTNRLLLSATLLVEQSDLVHPPCMDCNEIIKRKLLKQLKQTADPINEDVPNLPDDAAYSISSSYAPLRQPGPLPPERFENEEKDEDEFDEEARQQQPNLGRCQIGVPSPCEGLLCEREGGVRLKNCGHWSCANCLLVVCQCASCGANRLPLCPQEQCTAVVSIEAVVFAANVSRMENELFKKMLNRLCLHRIRLSKSLNRKQNDDGQAADSAPTSNQDLALTADREADYEVFSFEHSSSSTGSDSDDVDK